MRVSVAVMAHPDRAGFVDELCGRLDRDPTVVWDEIGDVWHTGRRAMLAYDPDADYHLVIQDDAVVCRDLVAGVEKALEYVERRRTLNLYMGESKRPALNELFARADAEGASFIVTRPVPHGVAVAFPTVMIDWYVAKTDLIPDDTYDRRLQLAVNKPSWTAWPSLVDHRQEPSLMGHRDGRRARRFIDMDRSALDVDWSGPVVRTIWN